MSAPAAGSCAATANLRIGTSPLRHPLPHSEHAQDRSILLPLYPQMTPAEQEQVVAALAAACKLRVRAAVDQPG